MIGSNARSIFISVGISFGFAMLSLLSLSGCSQETDRHSIEFTRVALESEESLSEIVPPGEPLGPRLVGVGSCTASGCHGGAQPDQIVGSEYNIWISADPHSQAHSVLYDDESLKIVQRLDGSSWNAELPPFEDPRCVNCHSTTFAPAVNPAGEVLTDGVGCEACHGPAEDWVATHFDPGLSDADRRRMGMWNTKDLFSRAQICASCHVGGPGREVNHDMIAAGHPRLQFEMGAYLQALPKHWDERLDREHSGDSFEFLVWALGQTATSQAAVKQLAERASHGKVWPELSEWSCSACHHNLLDSVPRQRTLAKTGGLSGRAIRWDDWNHHVVRATADEITASLGIDQSTTSLSENMSALSELAGSLSADRIEIAEAARKLDDQLDNWAKQLVQKPIDLKVLDDLMHSLVQNYASVGVIDSSQAMLVYDALASIQQSRLDMLARKKTQPSALDTAITDKLADIYISLTEENPAPDAEITRAKKTNAQIAELSQLLQSSEVSQ